MVNLSPSSFPPCCSRCVTVLLLVALAAANSPNNYNWEEGTDEGAIAKCSYTINIGAEYEGKTETTVWGVSAGDTALMMFGTTMVMFQTPAMGVAQAGMIRRKNSLSMLMQCVSGMAIGSILWYIVGYSLVFGPTKGGGIIGDPSTFFFFRLMPTGDTDCLAVATSIPGTIFACFQVRFFIHATQRLVH
jgi:hypothetical protein